MLRGNRKQQDSSWPFNCRSAENVFSRLVTANADGVNMHPPINVKWVHGASTLRGYKDTLRGSAARTNSPRIPYHSTTHTLRLELNTQHRHGFPRERDSHRVRSLFHRPESSLLTCIPPTALWDPPGVVNQLYAHPSTTTCNMFADVCIL